MQKKRQTLVILTPGFPASEADVNCLPMQQGLVVNLKKLYPQLHIIVLGFQYPYAVSTYEWKGITVISFNGRNKGGVQRLLLRKKLLSVLKKINQDNEIIGLLSFWYGECAWVGNSFAAKNGLKHFCWILGQDARKDNKYPQRVNARAAALVALSDFLQDEFEENHGTRPFAVIPPGIDTGEFSNTIQYRDIDIIGVGSLIPLKQFDIFIRVVNKLAQELPSIKAVICGNGPEKDKLSALISKLGLQENIKLMGELPHPKILSLMQRSKILLHPSSYEGFANVYAEALYAGAYVIGFCRPMDTIFDHQYAVSNEIEMFNLAAKVLSDKNIGYTSVLTYPIAETCSKIMGLFK